MKIEKDGISKNTMLCSKCKKRNYRLAETPDGWLCDECVGVKK